MEALRRTYTLIYCVRCDRHIGLNVWRRHRDACDAKPPKAGFEERERRSAAVIQAFLAEQGVAMSAEVDNGALTRAEEFARCSFCDDGFIVPKADVVAHTTNGQWLCSVCRNIPSEERAEIERNDSTVDPTH